jgi:hypothetical protein
MMDRAEHVRWCKERAREYLNEGDLQQAVASMLSDLTKHPDTQNVGRGTGMLGIMCAANGDNEGVRRFIEGFAE